MNTPSHIPLFGRIVLIGSGLIGSSLARAIHNQNLAEHVTVAARSQATLDVMLDLGLAKFATLDVAKAVVNADLVIFIYLYDDGNKKAIPFLTGRPRLLHSLSDLSQQVIEGQG